MGKTFFIGDLHWGDSTIIKLENRPFRDVYAQTNLMFENLNKTISDDDTVYIVGDLFYDGCDQYHWDHIKRLNGHKILIRGNHDLLSDEFYMTQCGIEKVYNHPIVLDGFFIVSHEPMYINSAFPYANIFAHVHGNPAYKTHSSRHFCVSAERINYFPISFDEIKQIMLEDEHNTGREDINGTN